MKKRMSITGLELALLIGLGFLAGIVIGSGACREDPRNTLRSTDYAR